VGQDTEGGGISEKGEEGKQEKGEGRREVEGKVVGRRE
jgi:hypothetical protein